MSVLVNAGRNGYQYRCIITDRYGNTVTSDAATLTAMTQLAIIKQPEDVTANPGETVRFSVEAQGDGLTYQWQFNGGTGWKNSTMTGCRTAAMSVLVNAGRNGYQYRCVITDRYGNTVTSDAAMLTAMTQ